ncbi:hypothetical protein [Oceanibacterium hippocampi]|uniref:Uncharacterized protein n=1 Tax=Oceanibacterium hippocampi TaxID=745714 RepID=A0A1Y5TZ19_9PROT|nr:hypothetical protein [Oceanibacterium hippocampi]SLN77312.1 hypothetical protein OCH7691_04382 [Oceanibacterium hippocampi]
MAIRLNLPTEDYWLDLGQGVRVQVRPLTAAEYQVAQQRSVVKARELGEQRRDIEAAGGKVTGLVDSADRVDAVGIGAFLFGQALARAGIVAWEGVLGPDGDSALPVTVENVENFMRIPSMHTAFVREYLAPLNLVSAEGNGSAPSPSGTGAAGATIAGGATKRKPRARKAAPARPAKNART